MLKLLEIFYSGNDKVVWGFGHLDMTWVTQESMLSFVFPISLTQV